METIEKFDYSKMKEDIKTKVEGQRFLKNQRKDVHIVGKREISAKDAAYRHQMSREDLRIVYAAYGLARGHSFSQTENHYPEENHPLQKFQKTIDRILEKYKILVKVEIPTE